MRSAKILAILLVIVGCSNPRGGGNLSYEQEIKEGVVTDIMPRSEYHVEICAHRLGKRMTYTEQTDILKSTSFSKVMALAQKYNIKVGAFTNAYKDDVPDREVYPFIEKDLLWVDLYWRYRGMKRDTDIDSTTYADETFSQISEFEDRWGRKPIAMSYGLGNYSYSTYVNKDFLGGRTSLYEYKTDYGVSDKGDYYGNCKYDYELNHFSHKSGSFRFYDYADEHEGGYESAAKVLTSLIDSTMINGGWLNNFHHWHNFIEDDREQWLNDYFALLASKQKEYEGQIYFAGYGEAVAYLAYRSIITNVVMYDPFHQETSKCVIMIETDNKQKIDERLLQVPISIKFSLKGTSLEGNNVKSESNLVRIGEDEYVVEIPYSRLPYAVIEIDETKN